MSAEHQRVALRLNHVSKAFPGVKALDDVDLTVYAGEVHGIVGENGAGKSTLMAVASGALSPEAGTVAIGGQTLDSGSTRQAQELGIAIVHQEPALLPDLTVAENMWVGVSHERRPDPRQMHAWSKARLDAWSPEVGIDPGARVEELRAEQRFIVDIVRALGQEPAVLVLDEPTEHLAGEDVERLFAAVRERVRAGGAVVYISHRIREVKQIADRISVLRDGAQRGTFAADALNERDIVDLIVGRRLDAAFPDKLAISDATAPVVVVDGLRTEGVDGLSLTVRPGEIVGFAGIEGNGQRDALRGLAGLSRTSGKVSVDGHPVRLGSSKKIAYLTGDRHREGIFPSLTVRETIGLRSLDSLSTLGLVGAQRERDFAQQAVVDLDVKTPSIETPIESLSGGNQQKVLLASVLRRNPRLLLIDEPTQGVDVGAKTEIYNLLRDSAREDGMGVVVVSSDSLELAGLCDRVLIFSRGQVVGEIAGADVTEAHITEAVLTATTHRTSGRTGASAAIRWLSSDAAPIAMVAVAVLLLGLYTSGKSSFYLADANVTGTLALVSVLGFVAMGQTMALVVGALDLSVGPLMGFVVVVESFFLTTGADVGSQALGWALLIAVPVAIGAINWALVDLVRMNAIVATLVTFIALQALSLMLRPEAGGQFDIGLTDALTSTVGTVPIAFIVLVVAALALQWLLKRNPYGIALRAVGSDAEASRLNGVRPARMRLVGFLLCSLLASAGALLLMAQVGSGDPTAGTDYTLTSISAAVIGGASIFGGRGSFIGTITAALLVTQSIGAVQFLNLDTAWASYLPGAMTLIAVAVYSKSRQHAASAH